MIFIQSKEYSGWYSLSTIGRPDTAFSHPSRGGLEQELSRFGYGSSLFVGWSHSCIGSYGKEGTDALVSVSELCTME